MYLVDFVVWGIIVFEVYIFLVNRFILRFKVCFWFWFLSDILFCGNDVIFCCLKYFILCLFFFYV